MEGNTLTPPEGVIPRQGDGRRSRLSVLLVEDDAGDALLVEELVADSGVPVELRWVRTLAEAGTELAARPADCVLLDLHLPDGQGLDALGRALSLTDRAAVVVLTGLAEERTGLAALSAGAQDYLVKGRVEGELLGRALRYAVERKQAERAALALRASQMRAQENARLERGLLPLPMLRTKDVTVTPRYRPGRADSLLGGDFYDVVETTEGVVHTLIGDVSGHGPDEAALGVGLRIAWRTLVLTGVEGARQLALLEQVLVAERAAPEIFATATILTLAPDRRTARVWRAGHHGLLNLAPDGTVEYTEPPRGPALGVVPGMGEWPEGRIELRPGQSLMLFTDGLFEGRTDEGRLGEEGLLALARQHATLPASEFVDTLIARAEALAADHGGLDDDLAVVHLTWSASP
ncbi:PP2C family protein-serine/threonine phosphatase [Actinacidiphila glaucinigra]|uniref:PP2C family protein-serine/threonine phosphatase n=1 Tax=Actinacidiphila glaucinigra TaxID=235986 RepID=UPI00370D7E0C